MGEVTSAAAQDAATFVPAPTAGADSDARPIDFVGAPTIGRFLLLRKLGEGGMGEVFSAYDEQLDRRVAVKVLHASHELQETRMRLLREAQALARLSHPNVVAVYEVGETRKGDVFVVMEHIDGITLREWQAEARSAEEILAAYHMAGIGLSAVHAAGMVHRDFKPANVMMDRSGRVRLLDFGLAHARGPTPVELRGEERPQGMLDARLTATGNVVGTPAFMSPEQFSSEPLAATSDQFSFCVALYQALYKVHPFAGGTALSYLVSAGEAGAPSPPPRPDVPARVRDALLRGLSRAPAARFESMADLCAMLGDEPDPSGQRRERIVVVAVIVGVMLAWWIYAELFVDPDLGVMAQMLIPAVLGIGVVAVATLLLRRSLLRNPFHRARLLPILMMGLFVVASRVAGLRGGEDLVSVATRDVMLCGVGYCGAALWLRPRTWLLPVAALIPVLGTAAIIVSVDAVEVAATLSLDLSLLVYLADWHLSGRRDRGAKLPAAES